MLLDIAQEDGNVLEIVQQKKVLAVEGLIKLLHNKDTGLRSGVVILLADINDPRVIQALSRVAETDNDADVRALAKEAKEALEKPSN
jgi:HEAT repeat protein